MPTTHSAARATRASLALITGLFWIFSQISYATPQNAMECMLKLTAEQRNLPLEISSLLEDHNANTALSDLASYIGARTLSMNQRQMLWGTFQAFMYPIAHGVLAFSARLTEELLFRTRPGKAHMIARYFLQAGVDEYGISQNGHETTHPELLTEFAVSLGLEREAAEANHYLKSAPQSAIRLGLHTHEVYFQKSVAHAVGFHLASEYIAGLEYSHWMQVFPATKYPGLQSNPAGHEYLRIHSSVEAAHSSGAIHGTIKYLEIYPENKAATFEAMTVYLNYYGGVLKDLLQQMQAAGAEATSD